MCLLTKITTLCIIVDAKQSRQVSFRAPSTAFAKCEGRQPSLNRMLFAALWKGEGAKGAPPGRTTPNPGEPGGGWERKRQPVRLSRYTSCPTCSVRPQPSGMVLQTPPCQVRPGGTAVSLLAFGIQRRPALCRSGVATTATGHEC